MRGTLLQLNVSPGGMPKLAVPHARVTAEGVAGDWQTNRKFHGGLNRAVCLFSMERILAMKQGAYGLFKGVVDPGKTKALDARTVQFTLNQPYAVFTSILAELWIVNSKLLRANEKSSDWGAAWLARNEAGSLLIRAGSLCHHIAPPPQSMLTHNSG